MPPVSEPQRENLLNELRRLRARIDRGEVMAMHRGMKPSAIRQHEIEVLTEAIHEIETATLAHSRSSSLSFVEFERRCQPAADELADRLLRYVSSPQDHDLALPTLTPFIMQALWTVNDRGTR